MSLRIRTGCTFSCVVTLILASAAGPAAAQYDFPLYPGYYAARFYAPYRRIRHQPDRGEAERVGKEPFGAIPNGPLQIFISIDQQKLHLYSDGVQVADTSVATGVPSLPTPLGVFSVIQKQVFHRSNLYSNAPMPFMQRITWSGVAIHEGENIGHPASHGCIRMPHDFAVRLYRLTRLGVPVIITRPEVRPVEFADPHLFVHRDKPPQEIAAAPALPGTPTIGTDAPPAAIGLPVDPGAAAPADPGKPDNSADAPRSDSAPVPPAAPAAPALAVPASKAPIAIFISRKDRKIYLRQDFAPLFDAAVTIADADKPLGTHVFTALNFAGDDHTTLRWDVVSLPGEAPPTRQAERERRYDRYSGERHRLERRDKAAGDLPPPQAPAAALARVDIPQAAIDVIAQLIVPGSSLVVSDEGLGEETGEGTNFIVVTR